MGVDLCLIGQTAVQLGAKKWDFEDDQALLLHVAEPRGGAEGWDWI